MVPKGRVRRSEAGFTLAEVLLAAVIITIAFVALLSVIPYSTSAVQGGNQTSTATFLANQKMEEAKNIPWTSTPDNDCLGVSANGEHHEDHQADDPQESERIHPRRASDRLRGGRGRLGGHVRGAAGGPERLPVRLRTGRGAAKRSDGGRPHGARPALGLSRDGE